MIKNVIVVGYPKSGNTWITRLTAELVGCPVVGFWHSRIDEIGREGQNRHSDLRCFKAHHLYGDLLLDKEPDPSVVIYVVRDPRDIAVSGIHYFNFASNQSKRILRMFPKGRAIYKRTLGKVLYSKKYKMDKMINALIHGDEEVHGWLRVAWREHYKSYLNKGILFIKYEDMLEAAEQQCLRILNYLNIERDDEFVRQVLKNQSFEKKKKEFLRKGQLRKAFFMRSGKSGQWKHHLSSEQNRRFIKFVKDDLEYFSYPLQSQ